MTPDQWELDVLLGAVAFTAFIQHGPHDRRREQFDVPDGADRKACLVAAYMGAGAMADMWAAELGRPGLIYAINAAGRQVLVTDALAKRAGLLP